MGAQEQLRLFLSYARDDQPLVEAVERDLEGDFEVWIDRQLSGGQQWWEVILEQIRQCDALLLVCTPSSLTSIACLAEMRYAAALGRTVIPLRCVEEGIDEGLAPSPLPMLQWLPYLEGDKDEYRTLLRALRFVERRPLPDVLPEPPKVPRSYVVELAEMIDVEDLDKDTQYEIMRRLEDKYDDVANHGNLIRLIRRLREREIFTTIDRRCGRLLEDIESYTVGSQDQPEAPVDPEEAFRARALSFLADGHLSIPERDSLHDEAQRLGLSDAVARQLLEDVARTAPGAEERRERYRATVRRTIEAHGHPLPAPDEADLHVRRADLLIGADEAADIDAEVVAAWASQQVDEATNDPSESSESTVVESAEPAESTESSGATELTEPPESTESSGTVEAASFNHGGPITAVSSSARASSTALAGQDLRLHVWDHSSALVESLWQLPAPTHDLSIGARYVAAATQSSCYVYDATSGDLCAALIPGKDKKTWVTAVLVGPSDDLVVAGAHNGAVEAWSPDGWRSLGKAKQRTIGAPVTCLALHEPDTEVLIGTSQGMVWSWSPSDGSLRPLTGDALGAPVDVAAASADGSVVVAGTATGVLRAVDRSNGSSLWQGTIDGAPLAAGGWSSGDAVAVVSRAGTVWRASATGLDRCALPVDDVVAATVLPGDHVLVVDRTGKGPVFAVTDFEHD